MGGYARPARGSASHIRRENTDQSEFGAYAKEPEDGVFSRIFSAFYPGLVTNDGAAKRLPRLMPRSSHT